MYYSTIKKFINIYIYIDSVKAHFSTTEIETNQ